MSTPSLLRKSWIQMSNSRPSPRSLTPREKLTPIVQLTVWESSILNVFEVNSTPLSLVELIQRAASCDSECHPSEHPELLEAVVCLYWNSILTGNDFQNSQ